MPRAGQLEAWEGTWPEIPNKFLSSQTQSLHSISLNLKLCLYFWIILRLHPRLWTWLPPPTSWEVEMAGVSNVHMCSSAGSVRTGKELQKLTFKGESSTPTGMQATFKLYIIGHLPIYLPWHDYLSGIILQQ